VPSRIQHLHPDPPLEDGEGSQGYPRKRGRPPLGDGRAQKDASADQDEKKNQASDTLAYPSLLVIRFQNATVSSRSGRPWSTLCRIRVRRISPTTA
jgi:hypothetical protein